MMNTLRIENDRIKEELKKLDFTDNQIYYIMRVYEEVDQELTAKGWSY